MRIEGLRSFFSSFTGLVACLREKKRKPCKWLDPVIAMMLAALTLLFSVMYLDAGHGWGDDQAAYLTTAFAIADGRIEEQNKINLFMHPMKGNIQERAYVWGYPLMLIPIYKLFGFNRDTYSTVVYYKLPGCLCMALLAGILYLFYRRRFSRLTSMLLTAALVFSVGLFPQVNNLYTDVPFLAFTMLSLYLAEAFWQQERTGCKLLLGILLGVSLWATYVIRLNGPLTLAAVALGHGLYQLRRRRFDRWLLQLFPYFFFGGILFLSYKLLPVPTSNSSDLGKITLAGIGYNLQYYDVLLQEWGATLFSGLPLFRYEGTWLVLLIASLIGFWFHKDEAHLFFFGAATFAGCCILDYQQGLRYLYPMLPVLLLLASHGFIALTRLLEKHVWRCKAQPALRRAGRCLGIAALCSVLAVTTCTCITRYRQRGQALPDTDSYSTEAIDLYHFIQQKTPEDSVIAATKCRAIYLNTGRIGFRPQVATDVWPHPFLPYQEERVDLAIADYVLMNHDEFEPEQLQYLLAEYHGSYTLKLVYQNRLYSLYQRVSVMGEEA